MSRLTVSKKRNVPALFVTLVALLLLVLNPVTSVAHALQAHTTQSQQDPGDSGSGHSNSNVCDLCLGLATGAFAAHGDAPPFHFDSVSHDAPNAAPIGLLRPVIFAAYRSRAPPAFSLQ